MHARRTPRTFLFTLGLSFSLVLAMIWPAMAAPQPLTHAQLLDQEATANRIADIRSEDPSIEDGFDVETGTWDVGYTGDTSIWLRGGQLYLAVDVDNTVAWTKSSTRTTDFYLEVDTTHYEGVLNNQFGVIFHLEDGDNFLYFAVGSDGYYSLQQMLDDEWQILIEWTESDVIETGEQSQNKLGVLSEGGALTLLINDYIVDQYEGIEPVEGTLALTAGTYEEPGVAMAFDNFVVWLLDSETGDARGNQPVRVPERPSTETTPEPVEEPDTPEPEPTPTPQPEDEGLTGRIETIRAEVPVFTDDFSQESADWKPNLFDGMDYSVSEGAMQIAVGIPNALAWSVLDQRYEDFYLEVDATYLDGPSVEEHGVLFRFVDPQNFYFFAISETGEFSLWRLNQNEWQTLQDWAAFPASESGNGTATRLGLLVEGEQFTLLVNDQIVLETSDDTFPTGAIGFALGTFSEEGASASFDDLTIWGVETSDSSLTSPDTSQLPPPEPTAEPVEEATEEPGSDPATGDFTDAQARIDEILGGDPTISDDFRLAQSNWDLSESENAVPFLERRALHIEVLGTDWIGWSDYIGTGDEQTQFSDFYTEVDLSFVQQPEGAAGGLVVRLNSPDDFYFFAVEAAGYYSLQKRVGGVWVELIPWTPSALIDTGEEAVNRLGLLAEGERLVLTLNGEVAGEVQDADLATGYLALFGATTSTAPVEVSYDNFALWDLSQ